MVRMVIFIFCFYSASLWSKCDTSHSAWTFSILENPRIAENSGMDFSRQHQDIFWTINDANNSAEIYAVGLDGKTRAEFIVSGAQNIDWEDISVAACLHDPKKDCIYVSDTGNNDGDRENFTVYVIEEPQVLAGSVLSVVREMKFKAPKKANLEAFAVNEFTSELYFISKSKKYKKQPSVFYSLKYGTETLTAVAELDFENFQQQLSKDDTTVTSADFNDKTQTLLVGSYGMAYEIKINDIHAFAENADMINIPTLEKSESIAYHSVKRREVIITSSEGVNQPIIGILCGGD